ncbi:phage antirepressor KilAC domain-containing protein [Sphingomonas sp. BE137]|uniref:phage antirepressor n=1 Tax=Sphingomonas sp. BE137 TaxID=2817844 RepID=UPI001AE3BC14|nr:phage antirepressor KilAC domain-containing protein [Sphingomonas sp. BE137]MDR6850356.1 prophage antirepressor-like protein [Sphingomonas sp. BE137]
MNAIVPFSFDGHAVRMENRDGAPWFVAADVCAILEIDKHRDAVARLDPDETGSLIVDTPGGRQTVSAINESGLWRLVLRSRKQAARRFAKWVTGEVLPSIRRTGGYGVPAPALDLADPATLHRLLIDHTGRAMASEERIAQLEPKADALARIADAQGSLCITDAAKALAVPPRRLFAWLEANSWIYRRSDGGEWVAFETKRQQGVVEHKGRRIEVRGRPDKWVEQVMVTPKGLAKLAEAGAGR